LIPTTPFILLAVWFFARSSKKFENWLLNHKIFGKNIRDWRSHGSISKNAKMSAIPLILFSFSMAIYFNTLFILDIILVVTALSIATFIISRPSTPIDKI
tara:strand:- start:3527 stop:3826 length:300 start_codon:yes stop_codon:yes gene_type:complete